MSDTPRTDAAEMHSGPFSSTAVEGLVEADFARQIERENAELLAEMERYRLVIERAEAIPDVWNLLTVGTGIATANGYRAAIAKATKPA